MSLLNFHLSLRAQLLLGFGLVLAISAAVSALAYQNTVGYGDALLWVRHTEAVIDNAETAHLTIEDLDNRYREYLLTGTDSALAAYRANAAGYPLQLQHLAGLTADNPPQSARWRAIASWTDELRATFMEPGVAARQQLPPGAAPTPELIQFELDNSKQAAFDEIGTAFNQGVQVERHLLAQRTAAVAAGSTFLLRVLLGGTAVTILLGMGIALLLSQRTGSSMERLAAGARAIAAGDLERRIDLQSQDEIGAVATAFDQMAAALHRDRAEREAVEHLKDEFVSVVSHELRTPLTSIRGSLGLLHAGLLGPISPRAERMLDVALSNTDRLIRLINDILDIERMRSGRMPMQIGPSNTRDVVRRAVDGLKGLAESARITLVEHAEQIELTIDSDRIVQALTNLIGNAIKFSPPQSTIEIEARRSGNDALFSVTDHGRGIPRDKLESIFGRFEQVDASDAREKGGTGLGLAISRSIVQLHGGRIWVDSTLGQGSTFSFTLPLQTPSLARSTPDAATNRAASHVLAVGDN